MRLPSAPRMPRATTAPTIQPQYRRALDRHLPRGRRDDGLSGFGRTCTLWVEGDISIAYQRQRHHAAPFARVPAIAIVPWFLAGSLFPIGALPGFLTWLARFLPLTHGLALVRYGLLDDGSGLREIWGMSDLTAMAGLSLAVVALFAAALTAISIRVFTRGASLRPSRRV
jgi:hypothetical protein